MLRHARTRCAPLPALLPRTAATHALLATWTGTVRAADGLVARRDACCGLVKNSAARSNCGAPPQHVPWRTISLYVASERRAALMRDDKAAPPLCFHYLGYAIWREQAHCYRHRNKVAGLSSTMQRFYRLSALWQRRRDAPTQTSGWAPGSRHGGTGKRAMPGVWWAPPQPHPSSAAHH